MCGWGLWRERCNLKHDNTINKGPYGIVNLSAYWTIRYLEDFQRSMDSVKDLTTTPSIGIPKLTEITIGLSNILKVDACYDENVHLYSIGIAILAWRMVWLWRCVETLNRQDQ